MHFEPGTQVDMLVHGRWVGPYTVTAHEGRTPEHLVLRGPGGVFEHYNDAPYNTRLTPLEGGDTQ